MQLLPDCELTSSDKPLLAFSGGADSTALLFTLLQLDIKPDLAIVHYGLRAQADDELAYARELAAVHQLQCHYLKAEPIEKNFEFEARKIRYDFFERLITQYCYTHLLTAHHLQDRLEWLLMQLGKGAGLAELMGMSMHEQRKGYQLYRPLLETSKAAIIEYLNTHQYRWFHDKSNDELHYKRNFIRHEIASKLLQGNEEGIRQSFRYLQHDTKALIKEVKIYEADALSLFHSTQDRRSDIYHIDKILKAKGYLLTASQREELRAKDEVVAGRKFIIIRHEHIWYTAPYTNTDMDKDFKEQCRQLGIPPKLRPYLYDSPVAFILYTRFLPCNMDRD